jgi:phosphate butyryltransferase
MKKIAAEVGFDISRVEQIFEADRQVVANLGTAMLFAGSVDMASKGQIPTSFIYRAIIREEARAGTGRTVSVVSLWEIPELNRFIAFTDTGVNIKPDDKAKAEVIRNAVFVFHVLGYPRPKIAVLSGLREIGGSIASYEDALSLKQMAATGAFGDCEIVETTSFGAIFLGQKGPLIRYDDIDLSRMPDILLVIPSRSDFCDSILGEIAMGVVVAERMKGGIWS